MYATTQARRSWSARLFAGFVMALASVPALATPDSWRLEGWSKTDFQKRSIEWSEILSGGPPKDGIPAIDHPEFTAVGQDRQIAANEPVIGLEIDGDARAYPIRILIWHEIVNDVVGGVPVAVTYCPLCNAAIVFDARVAGKPHTFGTTGKLRNSDLVMYDRETESWWQQFTGEAIVGKMNGTMLRSLPARLESFAEFKQRHPEGRLLVPKDASVRAYGRNPYEGYDTTTIPFLYRGPMPSGINAMARVVVVRDAGAANAVTLDLVRRHKRIEWGEYVLTWRDGQVSALDRSTIADGRTVGLVVVQKSIGAAREDVAYDVTFAFVFHAFNPERKIVEQCDALVSGNSSAAPASRNATPQASCKLEMR